MVLGHPIHAWQTAFVSWTAAETHGRPDAAYTIAAAAAEALGTSDALTMAAGSRDLWFWAATDDSPDLAALASLRPLLEKSATQLAIGIPEKGIRGFRQVTRKLAPPRPLPSPRRPASTWCYIGTSSSSASPPAARA
jgi:hypothetical protein